MISERQLKTKDRRKNKETKKKNITLKTNAAAPQFRLQCMRSSKWQRRLSCDAGIACEEEEDESVAEHNSRTARRQYIKSSGLPSSRLPIYLPTYWLPTEEATNRGTTFGLRWYWERAPPGLTFGYPTFSKTTQCAYWVPTLGTHVNLKYEGTCLRRGLWPHSAPWELKCTSSVRERVLEGQFGHILQLGNSREPQVQGNEP